MIFLSYLLAPAFLVLITCFFLYRKRNKKYSKKMGVALLIVSCLIGLVAYFFVRNYPFDYYVSEISVNSEHLESFRIDFDTSQQYEEWFCSDPRELWQDELEMSKAIKLENPHEKIRVEFFFCEDELRAKELYDVTLEHTRLPYRPTIKISEDYEYAIGDAYDYKKYNGFRFVPELGYYTANVAIRYKNVMFIFWKFPKEERESRLGEAIDLLWADYEQYMKEMSSS